MLLNRGKWFAVIAAALFAVPACPAEGTLTINFDGQPPGTFGTISGYIESGVTFWNPYGPENLARIGPNLSGTPQDGTAYLAVTAGAKLTFEMNPLNLFNLVSFDAAGYSSSFPGATLEVVGYQVMSVRVTNSFTVDSFLDRRANNLPDFQTFYPDSQFQGVYRVDVFTDRWMLDNLVLGGVPEPSSYALAAIGGLCWFAGRRMCRRRMP
jgi:hypothetical protein